MDNRSRIKILDESLCNQIAAGEVVERPASVVKELVENSIDAGADEIIVELESGGCKLIRVGDNGCGMNRQDVFLCLERHSTSKIHKAEDLFALTTLGFRGEALASIASVSRFRLRSSATDDGLGQELLVEGGHVKRAEEVGMARGTLMEARNLFFNLPARRKFLRREQTELGHCADVVTKQALSHPGISFKLSHNGRSMLDLRCEKGLTERVAALLGREMLMEMQGVDVNDEAVGIRLRGLMGQPSLNRSASTHIYSFINGRYIRDRVVQHAIMDGYRHLLMKGRFPVVVLFLEVAPDKVDVNVHPTKHEVRFRDQALVHNFIAASLQQQLKPANWVQPQTAEIPVPRSEPSHPAPFVAPLQTSFIREPLAPLYAHRPTPALTPDSVSAESVGVVSVPPPGADSSGPLAHFDDRQQYFSGLRYLGQYHNSYLLCQDGDDLLLIDQHAAHERIGFESLKAGISAGQIEQQSLMFPEILELDFRSSQALAEHLGDLAQLGFDVEPFGGKSFALKAVPQLLAGEDNRRLIVDIALDLEQVGSSGGLMDRLDDVLIMMACHGVIRANQALDPREARALLEQLDRVDFKANCPHGRPVMQRMRLVEIERLFRRQ
ncbi:DNA mismatch repair endonuclease MutL [Geopsychrobacter electrodiphilus]|uniref:DNA mismatch repair endonuclease MutL n=1 Tax=Geopsychrobacter electrodiphilus TaxID=225196 RepID=UPI0003A13A25|nr:DNA mismatch repair endonuclease MutL [Geopsychrobacter electrodiphilus]